jgi:hypothetical protein
MNSHNVLVCIFPSSWSQVATSLTDVNYVSLFRARAHAWLCQVMSVVRVEGWGDCGKDLDTTGKTIWMKD